MSKSVSTTLSKIGQKDLSAIRGALRQAFIRSDYRKEYLNRFKILEPRYTKSGKLHKVPNTFYKCEECEGLFKDKDINVDHVEKVGSFKSATEIESFFNRMWCSYDNLQVLCIQCHDDKTLKEKAQDRAKKRKEDKKDVIEEPPKVMVSTIDLDSLFDDTRVKVDLGIKDKPKEEDFYLKKTNFKLLGKPVYETSELTGKECRVYGTIKGTDAYRYIDFDCHPEYPEAALQRLINNYVHKEKMIVRSIQCSNVEAFKKIFEKDTEVSYSVETTSEEDKVEVNLDDLI